MKEDTPIMPGHLFRRLRSAPPVDAPCTVDASGYCSRHQQVHWGRFLTLCQQPDEVGAAYRKLWDRQPHPNLGVPLPASQTPASPSRSQPCQHLGEPMGALRECPSCRGTVRAKVFACAHPAHGEIVLADCKQCPDYVARIDSGSS